MDDITFSFFLDFVVIYILIYIILLVFGIMLFFRWSCNLWKDSYEKEIIPCKDKLIGYQKQHIDFLMEQLTKRNKELDDLLNLYLND
jgi:hypothetical protein